MAVKAIESEQKLGVGPNSNNVRAMGPPTPRRRSAVNNATHMLIIELPVSASLATRNLLRDQINDKIIRVRIPGDDHDLTLTWYTLTCSDRFLIFRARTVWDAVYVQQMTEIRLRTLRPATGPLRYAVTRILGAFIEM